MFWGCFGVCRRWKSKNRCKNRIFGLVEPVFPIIGPYIHIFAVAEARSGPPCDLVRILGVAVAVGNLPSLFIIVSFGERLRSTSAHLVRRRVQCLVGFYFSAVHALVLSEIVAARSMRFLLSVWKVH